MKIIGQWPVDKRGKGELIKLKEAVEAVKVGRTLRNKEDGSIEAIMDDYNDWVSPGLYQRGIKSRMEVMT